MLNNYFPTLEESYFPILEHVLGRDIHDLIIDPGLKVSDEQLSTIITLMDKLDTGLPMAYVLGQTYFYRDVFHVNSHVLIPRPETEYLVEGAIEYINTLPKGKIPHIIDVCTGSGCIGISIAKYVSSPYQMTLSDISPKALEICKMNIQDLLVEDKSIIVCTSNLLKDIKIHDGCRINILVSNPPYIPSSRIPTLDKSVKDFEPHLALDGGIDGNKLVRKLLEEARDIMDESFLILIEIDEVQDNTLVDFAKGVFPKALVSYEKDLFGCTRYLKLLSR